MLAHSRVLDLLKYVIRASTSSQPIEARIDQMLKSLSVAFQTDECFRLCPDEIAKDGFFSPVLREKTPLWAEEGSYPNLGTVLPEERRFLRPSFACIPLHDEVSFHGILYLGYPDRRRFSPEEKELLLLIGKEMGEVIGNAEFHQQSQQTISELTSLQEVGKAVTSSLKLEDLYERIVTAGLTSLGAKGGVLRIQDRKTGELKVSYSVESYDQDPEDERISKRVFFSKELFSFHPSTEEDGPSVLCAPLISKGRVFGTLAFYEKTGQPFRFNERDAQLLLTMANQTSSALENALTHYETSTMAHDLEMRLKQYSTLWELNKALLTTIDLERIIHMTLTAITMGDGLRFNRAMLFMVNQKDRTLEGTMAVGPDSAEEAGTIWSILSRNGAAPFEFLTHLEPPSDPHSLLNSIVRGVRVSLDQEQCILAKTVLQRKPFHVHLERPGDRPLDGRCGRGCHLGAEVGCYVGERLGRDPRPYSFATVPLWGKGEVIGVILVDNLYNQNPITEADLRYLSMFSNQAGLAIENANLYRNLEAIHQELKETQSFLVHQGKMAALGELSNSIAHEIRNPLVSIGGFARRLHRMTPDEAPEKRYTETIMSEVVRLEKILNDFYDYTRGETMTFKEIDLREVLEESLSMFSGRVKNGGIEVIKDYREDVSKIVGDFHHLKQAFGNLILNAYEAMKGHGTLTVHIHPVLKKGMSRVRVDLEDTGHGIDPENLHNIFNPFYTTKDDRLGLGLPIVHKIVTSHHGQIEVENRLGEGSTFIVTFPVKEEG